MAQSAAIEELYKNFGILADAGKNVSQVCEDQIMEEACICGVRNYVLTCALRLATTNPLLHYLVQYLHSGCGQASSHRSKVREPGFWEGGGSSTRCAHLLGGNFEVGHQIKMTA